MRLDDARWWGLMIGIAAGGCSGLLGIDEVHGDRDAAVTIDATPGAIDADPCPAAACADDITVRTCAGGVTTDTTCGGAMPICEAGTCAALHDVSFAANPLSFDGADMVLGGGIVVTDVDGDGLPDLLGKSKAGMYFHNQGGLAYAASVPFGPGTWELVADFDHDSHADLIAANPANSGVSDVYRGDGHGAFTIVQTDLPAVFTAANSVIGDLDRDGKLDFAYTTGDTTLSIVYGRGDGTFDAPIYMPAVSAVAHLALGDVDGDHELDLLAREAAGAVEVFLHKSGRSFALGVFNASPPAAEVFLAADFDGDGYDDVLTTSVDLKSTVVLPSSGDGTFKAAVPTAATGAIRGLALANVNGDRLPDVVELVPVVNDPVGQDFVALLGRGADTFKTVSTGYNDTGIRALFLVADLDGDHRDEILYSSSSNYTAYRLPNTTP
jgi:hypothetical protein